MPLASSNKCFFFKKTLHMMMGSPGQLKTGLLGWGGEYMNTRKWRKYVHRRINCQSPSLPTLEFSGSSLTFLEVEPELISRVKKPLGQFISLAEGSAVNSINLEISKSSWLLPSLVPTLVFAAHPHCCHSNVGPHYLSYYSRLIPSCQAILKWLFLLFVF